MNKRTVATAISTGIFVGAMLVACGPTLSNTSGDLDDVKRVAAVYKKDTRTVDVKKRSCLPEVKPTIVNKKSTTTVETVCKDRKVGTRKESYNRLVSGEKWCIELDNVKGDANADDKWFRVEKFTYDKFSVLPEGTNISDLPYISNGC